MQLGKINGFDISLDKNYRKLLLYPRLFTLTALNYVDKDGLPYEELRNITGLSEGTLNPTLVFLKKEELIRTEETSLDKKRAIILYITEKGKNAYKNLSDWFKKLIEMENGKFNGMEYGMDRQIS
ncbi:MAG: transcriptional regulator [Fervidicoccus sp.]